MFYAVCSSILGLACSKSKGATQKGSEILFNLYDFTGLYRRINIYISYMLFTVNVDLFSTLMSLYAYAAM